ncbi:MAG: hypothetical protein ACI3ZL_08680 [Candidatus Cryptobacteroides sp.]
MYAKVIKWIAWALFIVGVVASFFGFVVGFDKNGNMPVDTMLYCAYAMVAIAILAVLLGAVVISAINNPKSLIKLGIYLVGAAVIIAGAYLLAPGTPAVGYLGEPVSDMTLKLTDTLLNLTYLSCGLAIVSIIVGAIVTATRK